MTTRFNPALLQAARGELAKFTTKSAFVALGPQGGMSQQQQQQPQAGGQPMPQQGGQPQMDPTAMAQAQQAQQQPPPQQQQQPQQPMPQQAGGGQPGVDPTQSDQMRSVIREELERNEQKPKKLSIQDRVTQLEGMVLRVMEHGGLVPADPNLTSQQPSSTGVDAPANVTAPVAKTAGTKTASAIQELLDSVREQFLLGIEEMERTASEQSDVVAVGEADMNPIPSQELDHQPIFSMPDDQSVFTATPEPTSFADTIHNYYRAK